MPAGQNKHRLVVVKRMAIRVAAVMASQAVLAKGGDVSGDERRVDIQMAGGAARLAKAGQTGIMAVCTLEGRAIRHFLVSCKRESCRVVRKTLRIEPGEGSFRSAMIGMALNAANCLALGLHDVVKILRILGQVGVAGEAGAGHGQAAPGRGVAGEAGHLSVGVRSTQRQRAGGCIQSARTEENASPDQADGSHHHYR